MSATGWPLLVAEVANTHGGDEGYLRDLVARLAGGAADAVKFQPVVADEVVSPLHPMRVVFESLEMPSEVWDPAAEEVRAAGKEVWFDVYGPRSLEMATGAGAAGLKIHAMDADDLVLLDSALSTRLPVMLSCGGATEKELAAAVGAAGGRPLCLMLGFQRYPTPAGEARVSRIAPLGERLGVPVGYMDHVAGDDPLAAILPCMAVSHGAVCVEKHVFLPDRETPYDSQSALSPDALDELRSLLVAARDATGSPGMELSAAELAYRSEYRKVAVAARDLGAGAALGEEDVRFVRAEVPEGELPVHRADVSRAAGRALSRHLRAGEALTEEALS